jgi:hypothetical protein
LNGKEEVTVSKTIDLELTRAEVEVLELEARLRVVPMNDTQLSDALRTALAAKKERLAKLRTLHATAGRAAKDDGEKINPLHAGRRPPLKRTVPQRPQAQRPPAQPPQAPGPQAHAPQAQRPKAQRPKAQTTK